MLLGGELGAGAGEGAPEMNNDRTWKFPIAELEMSQWGL